MTGKRSSIDLDPDYEDISEHQAKRQRVLEQDAKQASLKKIQSIIRGQFEMETANIESDVVMIDQLLNQARTMMDRLRAVAVANYYSHLQQNPGKVLHSSFVPVNAIHPTVKKYLGKAPVATQVKTEPATSPSKGGTELSNECTSGQNTSHELSACSHQKLSETHISSSSSPDENKGSRFSQKKIIVVGNVSKYITDRERESNDHSTHKWMVYVRGPRDDPSIHSFVSKVWFFLHPSYRPNDRVEISTPPFHLTRRGWGEFPVRVQLHFWDERNKRVDIIHNLKLDRTYTGLQTLGAETVVDIELLHELPGNIPSQLPDHSLFSETCLKLGTVIKNEEEEEVMMGNSDEDVSVSVVNDKSKDKCLPVTFSEDEVAGTTNHLQEFSPAVQEMAGVIVKQKPAELTAGSQSEQLKSSISHEVHLTGSSSERKHVTNGSENPDNVPVLHTENEHASGHAKAFCGGRITREDGNKPQSSVGHVSGSAITISLPCGILSTQGKQQLDSVEVHSSQTNPKTLSSSPVVKKPALVLSSNSGSLPCHRASQSSVIVVSPAPRHPLAKAENAPSTNMRMVSLLQRPQSVTTPSIVCAPPRVVASTKQPALATAGVTVSPHLAKIKTSQPDANAPKVLMQVTPTGLKAINTARPVSAPTTGTSLLTPKEIVVARPPSVLKVSQSLLPPEPCQQVVVVKPSPVNSPLPRQQIVIVRPPVLASSSNSSSPQQTVLKMPLTNVPSKTNDLSGARPTNKVSLFTSPMTITTSVKPASSSLSVAPRTVSLLKLNGPMQNHSKLSDTSPSASGAVAASLAPPTPVAASSSSPKVTLVLPKTNSKPVLVNLDVSKLKAQGITLDTFSVNHMPLSTALLSHNKVARGPNTHPVMLVPPGQTTSINASSYSKLANSASGSSHRQQESSTFSVVATLAKLKEANEVKEHAGSLCSMPRTRQWFSQDHILMSSCLQPSVPGDGAGAALSHSAADDQLKIKLEAEGDKQCTEAEKRILAWKDKKQRTSEFLTTPQEQPVSYLSLEDYVDLPTLIRAAVLKHPLIDREADKFSRPYCAQSWQQWVSWNVGKQRAAEWTRAATVRKYLQHQLGHDGKFKGKQLWSTCRIMQWGRLHGQSPHRPGGQIVSPPTCEWEAGENEKWEESFLRKKFSSLSLPALLVSKDVNEDLDSNNEEESEIEVVLADIPKLKVKTEKVEEENQFKCEIFPPSEEAMFVQETAAKIGVKFLPTQLLPDVMAHPCEDMIYAAMLEFANELLNEAFAASVSSDKPLHTLRVPDVYQGLVHMPCAPLFTNQHLGSSEEVMSCNR